MTTDATNEAITMRIYIAREMLNDAVATAADVSAVARIRQLLSVDHSVDLILSTLLPMLGVTVDQAWSLPKQMTELCSRKTQLQSHSTPIERMHRLRNRVQHDGVIPSPEDVRSMMVHGESFVRDAVREVTGKELDEFSLVSMISDSRARQHLSEAMEFLRQADYSKAITAATTGFELALRNHRMEHIDRQAWTERIGDRARKALEAALADAASRTRNDAVSSFAHHLTRTLTSYDLKNVLLDIFAPIEMARYGVDMAQYGRFRELTPVVFWTINSDEPKVHAPNDWNPTQQDALFVVDFACTALLRWQQAMERPDDWRYQRRSSGPSRTTK